MSAHEGAFEDVLCYSGWWDCPRSGVALIDGKPHFFDCRFSEELDDYPVLYEIWPAGDQQLADALEAFREWDSGKHPPALARSEALAREQSRLEKGPLQAARTAVPEWHLDRNARSRAADQTTRSAGTSVSPNLRPAGRRLSSLTSGCPG